MLDAVLGPRQRADDGGCLKGRCSEGITFLYERPMAFERGVMILMIGNKPLQWAFPPRAVALTKVCLSGRDPQSNARTLRRLIAFQRPPLYVLSSTPDEHALGGELLRYTLCRI